MVATGSPRTRSIQAFVDGVLAGNSAQTRELVVAASGTNEVLDPLLADLRRNLVGSSVQQNRALRAWLDAHREVVVQRWELLGFPAPPTRRDLDVSRVVAFDFDQVLSVREAGLADLEQAVERIWGGVTRLHELQNLLVALDHHSVTPAIVSRNSKHVIVRALERGVSKVVPAPGLLRYFTPDLIFGCEDYGDDVGKSEVISQRILHHYGLEPHRLIFVDDMMMNICEVRRECCVQVLHVKGGRGMQQEHFDALRDWVSAE